MRRFLLVVVAGVVAHILTNLLRYQIEDMWAPPRRTNR